MRGIADDPTSDDYERGAVLLAAWVHAEIIRIHPFEDGNGRSSRLIMGHVLVSMGLLPIPVEACKQEYYDVLNRYFRDRDQQRLLDFFLGLYASVLRWPE